jgi:Domain of unknown function (DUF4055)
MAVDYIKQELKNVLSIYKKIKDCICGEKAIKEASIEYLPIPNCEADPIENKIRYNSYLLRAVFYNVTKRTLLGLVGQVFQKDSLLEYPEIFANVVKNADGSGVSLIQLSKRALIYTVAYGRCGLFIDFPVSKEYVSRSDIENGYFSPTIKVYEPWNIINWKTEKIGSKEQLVLVVLQENYFEQTNTFEEIEKTRYRVLNLGNPIVADENNNLLKINERIYYVELWDFNKKYYVSDTFIPKDSTGNFIKEIPFTFVGSENNDCEIDVAPLADIAELNISHYRNSADYEENCFTSGQSTVWASGLTKDWVDDVLKGKLAMGSRGGIMLPPNASVGIIQAKESGMLKEAMDTKERQMVAIGARLIQEKSVQRTATEVVMESSSEISILASCAKNVSEAFLFALKKAAMFISNEKQEFKFELNTAFNVANFVTSDVNYLITLFDKKLITISEVRDLLTKLEIAKLDFSEFEIEIKKQNNTQTTGVENVQV